MATERLSPHSRTERDLNWRPKCPRAVVAVQTVPVRFAPPPSPCMPNLTQRIRSGFSGEEPHNARPLKVLELHPDLIASCSSLPCLYERLYAYDSHDSSETNVQTRLPPSEKEKDEDEMQVEVQEVEGLSVEGQEVEGLSVEEQEVEGLSVEGQEVEGLGREGQDVEGLGVEGQAVEHLSVEEQGVEVSGRNDHDEEKQGPKPPKNEKVLEYPFNTLGCVQIFEKDVARLRPGRFLNDVIVEFGLRLWYRELEEKSSLLSQQIHICNTFFFQKLTEEGYKGVAKWTRNVDIFSKTYIVVPINVKYLSPNKISIYFSPPPLTRIFILDSLGHANDQVVDSLGKYLKSEVVDKKNMSRDSLTEPTGVVMQVPQQTNGCDCGIFLLHYVRTFFKNVAYIQDMVINRPGLWDIGGIGEHRKKLADRIRELSKEWKKRKGIGR
ncbi:hypothetical protein E1B28_008467 [Marasmius oreades]|uniref:Ubiquitin-like protease family profile domain-containing protein n=1 Tax=Marasmius oreades TaxID=181124 RepID=A0A9P7RZN2_9AGAR|nr:uncharacterized protein E1B28_008467 [Marasmius oreades]KAG7092091.1 hypothetical protein E1B28_008467 [Marasmius oreades]